MTTQTAGPSMSTPTPRRHWGRIAAIVFGLGLALAVPAVASADPGDIGFQGPAGPGGAPTGSKPESKLWFNDGRWWASMYDLATSDFYIWVLDQSTDTWSRTNTRLDDRNSTRADILWDGTKLYVASHNFHENDGAGVSRLYRYSYNTSTDTYALDSGFPATINSVRSETLVIAKDSTGQLWATWEAGGSIWLNRTTGADNAWGSPFVMPGAATVNTDDISSIIAFGGDKVGVFWSNQSASPDADFFAIHNDADGDTTWTSETAYSGTNVADDHINLKTDSSGRVYSLVKTSVTGANPLIVLLVREAGGGWTNHTVSLGTLDETRGILAIDEVSGLLHVFVTSAGNGGTINERVSAMGSISFAGGEGTVVLKDASALKMNNATGTKQNISAASGLIVVGYNDTTRQYWHADILGGGPPPNTAPTANATSATTTTDVAVGVALSGSDPETCELSFSIVTGPAHGTLGSIGGAACASGSPNTDSASVTYTPTTGYSGPDSFTYKVNDGTTDSSPATATLTVNGGPDITPPTRGSSVVFGATLEVTYDEPLNASSTPAGTDFAVAVNGNTRGVNAVTITGSTVTLTLASPVIASDSVTLGYTPGAAPIEDLAGNDAASFSDVAVANQTPPPGPTSQTFTPTADAQVRSSTTTTNFGTLTTIRLGGEGTTTTYRTYLKFNVTGLTGSVTAVKLRLFATDASSNIVHVLPVADTSWIESGAGGITWDNRPAMGSPEVGSGPVPTLTAYNDITLSPSSVSGNGVVSFGLTIERHQQRHLQQQGRRQRSAAGRDAEWRRPAAEHRADGQCHERDDHDGCGGRRGPVGQRSRDVRAVLLDRDRAGPRHARFDRRRGLRERQPEHRQRVGHVHPDDRLQRPRLVHLQGQRRHDRLVPCDGNADRQRAWRHHRAGPRRDDDQRCDSVDRVQRAARHGLRAGDIGLCAARQRQRPERDQRGRGRLRRDAHAGVTGRGGRQRHALLHPGRLADPGPRRQ